MAAGPVFARAVRNHSSAPGFAGAAPAPNPASHGQTLAAASMPAAHASAGSGFAPQTAAPAAKPVVVFSGVPAFAEGQAVLFDSTSSKDPLPESGALTRLELRFPGGAPEPGSIDP